MNLDKLTVTTTNGSEFTGQDSADMARLVYRRFGCNLKAACAVWRRMLQNNCPEADFAALVTRGRNQK